MNITDVDDKIIKGARAESTTIAEISDRYAELFLADMATLGIVRPDVMPRATAHIPQMVELIQKLLDGGHAYKTDDGSIFFRIASWPDYGRLARLDPEGMRVGERVESDEYGKDDVRDFVVRVLNSNGYTVISASSGSTSGRGLMMPTCAAVPSAWKTAIR